MHEAKKAEAHRPVAWVVATLKDFTITKDMPTQYGSKIRPQPADRGCADRAAPTGRGCDHPRQDHHFGARLDWCFQKPAHWDRQQPMEAWLQRRRVLSWCRGCGGSGLRASSPGQRWSRFDPDAAHFCGVFESIRNGQLGTVYIGSPISGIQPGDDGGASQIVSTSIMLRLVPLWRVALSALPARSDWDTPPDRHHPQIANARHGAAS
ncbi:hypothetical protein ACVWXM_009585 [Bradyrhizobium sp. GM7.3]